VARRERTVDPELIAAQNRTIPDDARAKASPVDIQGDITMGKYLVGWLLGVPVFVLVILYFFFH